MATPTAAAAVNLTLNGTPQTVANGNTANVTQANNASLITVAPIGQDITATVLCAGTQVPNSPFNIPGTVQMPYPVIYNWNSNNIAVTNMSQITTANVAVGFFGVASGTTPTYTLSGNYQTVSQFQTIGGNSTSGPSTIQLLATNNNVCAVLLFGYGATPKMYVLNYAGSLPPIFTQLPAGVLVTSASNMATITDNFWGNYLFMVNISMAATTAVQARILNN